MKNSFGFDVSHVAARFPWLGPRLAIRLHRMGLGLSAVSWPELAAAVEREKPRVLSVDIFDTSVVRDLLGDNPIEAAIDRRSNPEDEAHVDNPGDLETLLCRPVPDAVDALARVRAAGTSVFFLSDTDRSSATLTEILSSLGIWVEGDRLVVSCEMGATKSDGDIYNLVWPDGTDGVWHVGNNLWADVAMAQNAGLRAFPIVTAEPTRYENAMAANSEGVGPAVASAARSARLEIMADCDRTVSHKQLRVVGAEVPGQAFSAFLLWVAKRCRDEGIEQVWFLSRDGEIFHQIAEAMPGDHWEGMELGYMHCSRWTWILAGADTNGLGPWLEAGTRDPSAFIHGGRHRVPFESLLGRIGLTQADLTTTHPALAALTSSEPLPEVNVPQWDAMLADPVVGNLILERSAVRRELIFDYLNDLGMSGKRVAMVDVGWRGRLAWAISGVARKVTANEPIHLHLGGDKVWLDADIEADIERFAFDGLSKPFPIANPVSCVETLTASGKARVVDYERTDKGVVPVLKRELSEVDNEDRQMMWAGALATAANMPSNKFLEELDCPPGDLVSEAREVLSLWWTAPVRSEVEALRGLFFETDDDGRAVQPVIMPYSPRELSPDEKKPRQWQEGSRAVSNRPFAALISLYQRVTKSEI